MGPFIRKLPPLGTASARLLALLAANLSEQHWSDRDRRGRGVVSHAAVRGKQVVSWQHIKKKGAVPIGGNRYRLSNASIGGNRTRYESKLSFGRLKCTRTNGFHQAPCPQ
jgi:hypothetical protein